jgi:hypothetical protein
MVSGRYLSQEAREQVWAHVNLFNRSPRQIWRDLFFCVRVTLRYVEDLCRCASDGEQADSFLFPTKKRSGGRKLKVSSNAAAHLLAHMRSHPQKTQVQALSHLASDFYGSVYNLPHLSTICRTLQRRKFNCKVMERRHINRDPIKRALTGTRGLSTLTRRCRRRKNP